MFSNCLHEPDCPGTEAEQAGKASACEGCPNQQICATAPKGPDPGVPFVVELVGRGWIRCYNCDSINDATIMDYFLFIFQV